MEAFLNKVNDAYSDGEKSTPDKRTQPLNKEEKQNAVLQQTRREKALKRHLTTSPTILKSGLYEPHWTYEGKYELPRVVTENQCDSVMNEGVDNAMTRISVLAREYIVKMDTKMDMQAKVAALKASDNRPFAEFVPTREIAFSIKKFLMAHDKTYGDMATAEMEKKGDLLAHVQQIENFGERRKAERRYWGRWNYRKRAIRKRISREIGLHMNENYTNMAGLTGMFDELKALGKGDHIHDVTDVLLQGLQCDMSWFGIYAQGLLGPRDRGVPRPRYPCLTPEQMHSGGTLKKLIIDPGLKNIGLMLLEFVDMQSVPADRVATSVLHGHGWTRGDPEPCFRILLAELIDLDSDWSDTRGHAVVTYQPVQFPGEIMRPEYHLEYGRIENLFYESAADKKRKRAQTAGSRKRLRKTDGSALAIDEQPTSNVLIDLTKE
jgi:hypothetical protein